MENKELIYLLAERLDMIIEVEKDGIVSRYRFIDGKLFKLN